MPKTAREDPYRVLGVGPEATDAQIVVAFRALAWRFHPDLAGEGATVQMMRINLAFDAIRDADHRAAWAAGGDGTTARRSRAAERSPAAGREASQRTHHGSRPKHDGTGGAGPPPGRPSGTVLDFGRHIGWSIGEVARVDPGYLEWLEARREGRPYLAEIDETLRRIRYRGEPTSADRRRPTDHRSKRVFRR